jgi:23S rRNA pseudouridine955/2504/2580 synthase
VNVHRLDFNTSRVFVVAKNPDAFCNLARQFRERAARKVYVALTHGCPAQDVSVIELPIGVHPRTRGLSRVDGKHGKSARSIARVKEKFQGYTLLEVEIETGRLHQVRVHLQAIGCPVVGDADYGGAPLFLSQVKRDYKTKAGQEERPLLARPALHAERLTIAQPTSGLSVTITAPWRKDLAVAVKSVRRFSAR